MDQSRPKFDPAVIQRLEEIIMNCSSEGKPSQRAGRGRPIYQWLLGLGKNDPLQMRALLFVQAVMDADFETLRNDFMVDVPASLIPL